MCFCCLAEYRVCTERSGLTESERYLVRDSRLVLSTELVSFLEGFNRAGEDEFNKTSIAVN